MSEANVSFIPLPEFCKELGISLRRQGVQVRLLAIIVPASLISHVINFAVDVV
ncbi:hypothetical protein KSX_48620 [Ktedonospora formicarum]|uniref:Uncharacterized protein n=1 Tax=Ktedonospora formicarum TaxID=2778364 RepID=A0A8J3I777_9CHLR|nr:hypothetical protein KSX_48620 [Ktedonospora formicarum]